ncbi:MAG TPA: NAD(P)H-hydrate dehydratase [Bacteroidales bacterium]|nr:NAD(P)H-hydrate dehydratase [Bacteroidales bacterium]
MKIFSCGQIRKIDEYTVRNEPVSSVDLMERAAGKVSSWLMTRYSRSERFIVFAGPGNNGGDGLAVARMLKENDYDVEAYFLKSGKRSDDFEINYKRLEDSKIIVHCIEGQSDVPLLPRDVIIIDAIFGSGLNRPVEGVAAHLIKVINESGRTVISIDVPSGLFCEDNSGNNPGCVINADFTLTFQFPKLAFMFADNNKFTGKWEVLDIGLHRVAIDNEPSEFSVYTIHDASSTLHERKKFDHKGVFGHCLLVAGSYGKIGAAVLGSKAALRAGAGLLSCYLPGCGYQVLQSSVPEAMVITDSSQMVVSDFPGTEKFSAAGIGPGLGTQPETANALKRFLDDCSLPLVIDADGINIIASDKSLLSKLPARTVLTPHPGEFDRLAGKSENGYLRLMKQVELSKSHNIIIVLKGAYTSVSLPSGKVFFNSTGNPGMATAGSGDVLTGIILSLLGQRYSSEDAALLGVFIHGLAGDIAASEISEESMMASDIINYMGKAFNKIRCSVYE